MTSWDEFIIVIVMSQDGLTEMKHRNISMFTTTIYIAIILDNFTAIDN